MGSSAEQNMHLNADELPTRLAEHPVHLKPPRLLANGAARISELAPSTIISKHCSCTIAPHDLLQKPPTSPNGLVHRLPVRSRLAAASNLAAGATLLEGALGGGVFILGTAGGLADFGGGPDGALFTGA